MIATLYLDPAEPESLNMRLQKKYSRIQADEPRAEGYRTGDAFIVLVAFRVDVRIAKEAVCTTRNEGLETV